MRFLKQQSINRRQLTDHTVFSDVSNANVYINPKNAGSMVLPSGTDAQIPASPVNGMMRYNTDHSEVQVYQSNSWRSLRFKESTQITQQSLGAGDGANIYFGPLSPAPPILVESTTTWGGQNLLVIVENVIQLSTANYSVVQNPTIPTETYTPKISYANGSTLYFNSHVLGVGASATGGTVTLTFTELTQTPFAVGSSITVSGFIPTSYNGTFTVTASTASSVSYTGAGTGTMTIAGQIKSADAVYTSVDLVGAAINGHANIPNGTIINSFVSDPNTDALISVVMSNSTTGAIPVNTQVTITEATQSKTGYYLKFSSPVPFGKMVTVLHGFDK